MSLGRALAALALVVATAATFWPVRDHGFVNWDDPETLATNPQLQPAAESRVSWAFSTTHMEHYQPLSWLVYAWFGGTPPRPSRVHTLALALHLVNVGLLMWLATRLAGQRDDPDGDDWWVAAAVALFAVHPLRVEPVAWASALPYVLSYAPLLVSVGCWLTWTRTERHRWLWAGVLFFGLSQLARVTAPLLPFVLVLMTRADRHARRLTATELVTALTPFVVVAAVLGAVEANARAVETFAEVGVGARLANVVTNPALYLWRTVWPGSLNPLDVLPRSGLPDWGAALVAVIAAAAVVLTTVQLVGRTLALAVWGSYLLLLLPVLGLTPSGVQATADRYTYGPAMVLSLALAVVALSAHATLRRAALVAVGAVAVFFGLEARAQTAYWHDSVALWTRALQLDGDNDVALYNLALAQVDAGQTGPAIERLQRLLALVPDHEAGRRQLSSLVADRDERLGDAQAAAGHFAAAVTAYDLALEADPARVGVRAKRGMAQLELGRLTRGAADLEEAVRGGIDDAAVTSALAFMWSTGGRAADALALLRTAVDRRPDDRAAAGNLARLLVTAEPDTLRNPREALALASRLNTDTGGRDIRVLDTLALALVATGQPADAVAPLSAALELARAANDRDLTAALEERLAALRR